MSFKRCVLTSEPQDLYCWALTDINAISASILGSNEIFVIVYQKIPGSPNDVQ